MATGSEWTHSSVITIPNSIVTSDLEESSSESDTAHNDPSSSPLATDLEQYELMQTAYKVVGLDFEDKKEFVGSEYHKLLRLESVSWRWPLARLSISPQKIVNHLDRVLALAGRPMQHVPCNTCSA